MKDHYFIKCPYCNTEHKRIISLYNKDSRTDLILCHNCKSTFVISINYVPEIKALRIEGE